MSGKKVLITAGPTREQIDPVRYISNNSSGKMGVALAEAALEAGAEVTLICGPVSIKLPDNIKIEHIVSTDDLYRLVKREFPDHDCLIMAAAPADYTPAKPANHKLKKSADSSALKLLPTVDILKAVSGIKKPNQKVIGFALETENGLTHAREKLKAKDMDMIVLNMPSDKTAFEHDTNQVTLIRPKAKPVELPLANKIIIAEQLLDYIAKLW